MDSAKQPILGHFSAYPRLANHMLETACKLEYLGRPEDAALIWRQLFDIWASEVEHFADNKNIKV